MRATRIPVRYEECGSVRSERGVSWIGYGWSFRSSGRVPNRQVAIHGRGEKASGGHDFASLLREALVRARGSLRQRYSNNYGTTHAHSHTYPDDFDARRFSYGAAL